MKAMTITSTRTAAGKTTVGLGIALNSGMRCGYFKPYGDHLVYSKKELLDLDAMVFRDWLGANGGAPGHTLGFDADTIMSKWGGRELDAAIKKGFAAASKGRDLVIVETARNYSFGGHMDMDSVSLAQKLDSEILLVADGDAPLILDKVMAISKCAENIAGFKGIVINKVPDEEREKLEIEVPPVIERRGIRLLGMLPRMRELERGTVRLVLEKLNARLIAGSEGVDNIIDMVQVGALSAEQAMKMPTFFTDRKMLITGGDRVDLIFASLQDSTAGIVLTNNILPHPKVIAKADDMGIPIISVHMDTYSTAKAVEHIIAEIAPGDEDKRQMIKDMARKNLDLDAILG
jgi:hypothetical protein